MVDSASKRNEWRWTLFIVNILWLINSHYRLKCLTECYFKTVCPGDTCQVFAKQHSSSAWKAMVAPILPIRTGYEFLLYCDSKVFALVNQAKSFGRWELFLRREYCRASCLRVYIR